MTWRRTGDVLCNSHDLPSLSSHPATGAGPPPARPRAGPWHSVTISLTGATVPRNPTRPPCCVRTAVMKPGGGNGVRRRACIRTPIPPPGCMLALRTSWAGVWEFGDTEVPGGAGTRGARTCTWPGGCMWGCACGMAIVFRGSVGNIRRRCFSTSCTLERTYVQVNVVDGTGYTSSDGIYIPRRADGICRPDGSPSPIAQACRHCLVHAG